MESRNESGVERVNYSFVIAQDVFLNLRTVQIKIEFADLLAANGPASGSRCLWLEAELQPLIHLIHLEMLISLIQVLRSTLHFDSFCQLRRLRDQRV